MPVSRFARYIRSSIRRNNAIGDLARYVNEHSPALFQEEKPAWDQYFATVVPPAPPNIRQTYENIARMMTTRSGTGRPAFAAYMWRYRRYTGPTTELALLVESIHPDLFSKDYDEWVSTLTGKLPPYLMAQLELAHRRSLRDPSDPIYARHINKRYGSPPDGK